MVDTIQLDTLCNSLGMVRGLQVVQKILEKGICACGDNLCVSHFVQKMPVTQLVFHGNYLIYS